MVRRKSEPKPPKSKTSAVPTKTGRSQAEVIGILATNPHATAGMVSASFSETFGNGADWHEAATKIRERAECVHDGDMRGVESTLVAQAAALNNVFTDLARRAAVNIGQGNFLNAADTYMKLALRAQNQCRMTLETLATIRNPPVVFAKQANIAHGPQQVNNGDAVPVARAETQKPQPEQSRLTHDQGQSLDFGASAHAIGSDTALATVGEINGAENGDR